MADTPKISATERTDFGKGAARRARRDKMIPVVVYGENGENRHLVLPSHETFLALKNNFNALIEIEVAGEKFLALTKDIQLHPVRRTIEHVDFVVVKRGEMVSVDVPIRTEGETEAGTIHVVDLNSLTVTADATAIPEAITVDIDGLADGTTVRVADLVLPADVTTDVDPEYPVVTVSTPQLEAELEAAEEELAEELGVDVEDLADQKDETEEGEESSESAEGESEKKSEDSEG